MIGELLEKRDEKEGAKNNWGNSSIYFSSAMKVTYSLNGPVAATGIRNLNFTSSSWVAAPHHKSQIILVTASSLFHYICRYICMYLLVEVGPERRSNILSSPSRPK